MQKNSNQYPECYSFIAILLLCFSLTLVAYWPVLSAWFVLDDYNWLETPTIDQIKNYFLGPWGHGLAYRPLMRVDFMMDSIFFQKNPIGWHLHSIMIHAINSACLFLVLEAIQKNKFISVMTAVLFAVSPLGNENISWISARTHILASFFLLTSLLMSIYFLKSKHYLFLVISILLFIAGLMTYEAVISLPGIVLVYVLLYGAKYPLKDKIIIVTLYIFITICFFSIREYILSPYKLHMTGFDAMIKGLNATEVSVNVVIGNVQRIFNLFAEIGAWKFGALLMFIAMSVSLVSTKRYEFIKFCTALFLVGALIYAPFMFILGVTHRFLYIFQIIPILAVVYAIHITFEKVKYSNVLSVSVACVLIYLNIQSSYSYAKDWQSAGQIAFNILSDIKRIYPEPTGACLIFDDIPNGYNRAGIFLTYFHQAIRDVYHKKNLCVIRTEEIYQRRDTHLTSIEDKIKGAKFFRYDSSTRGLVEISMQDWRKSNPIRSIEAIDKSGWLEKHLVISENKVGYVDSVIVSNNTLSITGWLLLDFKADGQTIYVISSDLPISHAQKYVIREDVVARHENPSLLKSGFSLDLQYPPKTDLAKLKSEICLAYKSNSSEVFIPVQKNSCDFLFGR